MFGLRRCLHRRTSLLKCHRWFRDQEHPWRSSMTEVERHCRRKCRCGFRSILQVCKLNQISTVINFIQLSTFICILVVLKHISSKYFLHFLKFEICVFYSTLLSFIHLKIREDKGSQTILLSLTRLQGRLNCFVTQEFKSYDN